MRSLRAKHAVRIAVAIALVILVGCADLLGIQVREVRECEGLTAQCLPGGAREVCLEDGSDWVDAPCDAASRCDAEADGACLAYDPIVSLSHGIAFGHACAVTAAGRLVCWGTNSHGQLGKPADGRNKADYVSFDGDVVVAQVTTGFGHTCFRTTTGDVLCFGENDAGQVDPSVASASIELPLELTFAKGALDVRASAKNTCAVMPADAATPTQHVLCWGHAGDGKLGLAGAGEGPRIIEMPVGTSAPRFAEAGERHVCALHVDGEVSCWGLGVRTGLNTEMSVEPHLVDYLTSLGGATDMSVGDTHTLAIVDGAAHCFGGNGNGQCDGRTFTDVTGGTPVASDVLHATSGWRHSCLISEDPQVPIDTPAILCYGKADRGALGTVDAFEVPFEHGLDPAFPVEPPWDGPILDLTSPFEFSCALARSNNVPTVYCWGQNESAQCGVNGDDDVLVPTKVEWPDDE